VPYLSALEVFSRQGAMQIHVYLISLTNMNLESGCVMRVDICGRSVIREIVACWRLL